MNTLIKNTAIFFGLMLALIACSPVKTVEEYAHSAQILMQQAQYKDAVIHLKNGIRDYNKNSELRELLGETYLIQGKALLAEKEIQKAFQLGSEKQSLFPMLLQSLYLQDKFSEIKENFDSKPRLAKEELVTSLFYMALAEHALGNVKNSIAYISKANEIDKESVYSYLGSAFVAAYEGRNDESLALVEDVIRENDKIAEAHMLKGQLLSLNKDYPNAVKAYKNYLTLLPYDVKGKVFLVNSLVSANEFSIAEPYVDELLKLLPNSTIINQFKGLVNFNKKNFEGAKRYLEKAIQGDRNNPSNNLFAGIANYRLKNFEQAYKQLSLAAPHIPENHIAWRYIASTQLALGHSENIYETMDNISYDTKMDSELFLQVSQGLLKSGKKDEAYNLLLRGSIIDGNNSELIAQQGFLKIKSGHLEGIEELEKSLALKPSSEEVKQLLIQTYLSHGFTDKALALATKMLATDPNNIAGYNLSGLIYLQKKQFDEAKSFFDQARVLNPKNILTYLYYSEVAELDSNYKLAISYYEELLDAHPNYVKGLYKYYLLQNKYGDVNIALERLAKVVKTNPNELQYQLLYASVLMKEKQAEKVVALLEPLKHTKDVPSYFWDILGDSYIQTSQIKKALSSFEKWHKIEGSAKSQIKLAMALSADHQYERALATLNEVSKDYDDSKLLLLKANASLGAKKFDETLLLIKEIASLGNELPSAVLVLKGKALLGKNDSKAALTIFSELYRKNPSENMGQYVAIAYAKSEENDLAIRFLEKHLQTFSNDTNNRFKLAGFYLKKSPTKAIEHYQIILNTKPKDFIVLNNLAWLSLQNNELDIAYHYAQKALEIAPNNDSVKDTYDQVELKRNSRK